MEEKNGEPEDQPSALKAGLGGMALDFLTIGSGEGTRVDWVLVLAIVVVALFCAFTN